MKRELILILLLGILLANLSFVSAITGSIGNARMILHAEQGDEIEKYVLVKNVNDVAVDIEITASGDLADYVDIQDEEFSLEAGEEKKAYFTIQVKKAGTTETKINVKFTPQEGKNGVGLSSTIVIIAEKSSWFDWGSSDEEDEECEGDSCNTDESEEGVSVTTGKVVSNSGISTGMLIAFSTTGIVFIALVVLLVLMFRKTKNKKNIREKEGKIKLRKRSGNK